MNAYDHLRGELAKLATPLRDPEPLRDIVDGMLFLLSKDHEAKMRLRDNLRRLRESMPGKSWR